ncbi:MAG TPA: hypothetical protein ENI60_00880 [Candidatus Fraserbacteria bacterium]|nr:hypothetical protein [Candidatus Fraserbacteria bacterium]
MRLLTLLLVVGLIFFGLPLFSGQVSLPQSLQAPDAGQFLAQALHYWQALFDAAFNGASPAVQR